MYFFSNPVTSISIYLNNNVMSVNLFVFSYFFCDFYTFPISYQWSRMTYQKHYLNIALELQFNFFRSLKQLDHFETLKNCVEHLCVIIYNHYTTFYVI